MNAGKRGPKAIVQAKATGLEPGEPDLRIYIAGGTLRLIEYKAARGQVSPDQRDRHAALARVGFPVTILRATTEQEAADQTEALVASWLPSSWPPSSWLPSSRPAGTPTPANAR